MTLRHFRVFVAVCDTMSMTEAAGALFISQSAVSQVISELEKYYGIRLFERLNRRLYLTQAGDRLLSYARHMIRMNADIEKDMKALQQMGFIRLGASVTVGAYLLPSLVSVFKRTNPETGMEVVVDNTEQIEGRLLGDKADLGLVEGEIKSRDLLNVPFMKDELVLICGARHPFARVSAVKPEELEKEDFIVREVGSGTRKMFEDVMASRSLSWKESWSCSNTDAIKEAVIAGLGVSVISRRAVEKEVRSGQLVVRPVEGIRFERAFKMVYHKNKFLTPQLKDFMDVCLRQDAANAAV